MGTAPIALVDERRRLFGEGEAGRVERAAHFGDAGLAEVHLALVVFIGGTTAHVRRVIDNHACRLVLFAASLVSVVVAGGVGRLYLVLLLLLELDGLV